MLREKKTERWDAFLGRSKPAPKEKRDSKEANKVYDGTKRKRKIQQSWRDDFPWLITDDKEEVLQNLQSSVWAFGDKNIKFSLK